MRKSLTMLVILCILSSIGGGTAFAFADENENNVEIPYSFMTESDFYRDFVSFGDGGTDGPSNETILYFKNLYTYSPVNSHGSCGYVSFIQYLSYYDTFWNDSIIPTKYERNQGNVASLSLARAVSPGVVRQSYPNDNLYDYIQNNKATDFQMYLMSVVNESQGNSVNDYSYSIGMWDYDRILNELFKSTTVTFTYKRVRDFGLNAKPTDQSVIDWFDLYVKHQINLGNPVMLHIADYNEITAKYEKYHSVVAYYYDDNGIHAHFGWGETSSDVVITDEYQITEAGVMSLDNVEETHSNNYLVNNIEYCGCGYFHEHEFTTWRYLNKMSHVQICACGYRGAKTQNHMVRASETINNKAKCLGCKRLLDLNYDIAVTLPEGFGYKYTVNGSRLLPNGIAVLVDCDIDSYIDGTLIFYNANEIPKLD